ncbi:hypothetical protein GGR22_002328 [Flavobacterium gossypii]|uniref:Dual OB-containing domain-containing protein n=1 Tax=Flavobacterium gossypii TaxID=1646119 RepID=A0ABR6DR44_9FLAO|nr:hypothetical protein [Flavobacterium gossypii]MBA9074161.1 hypothetical protein [Flavobacterium gossypii]
MEVIIVAKTKWGEYFCIGAIEIATNKYVRLMRSNGGYQPSNTPFKIGQVWELNYICSPGIPPHIEDVQITSGKFIKDIQNLNEYITKHCKIWQGDPTVLFDSFLKWENKSGYLNDKKNTPLNSVGFWKCDKDLVYEDNYYIYKQNFTFLNKRLPYKGIEKPVSIINSGTLIRVSLAKWWPLKGEERCYLQLSGWYN